MVNCLEMFQIVQVISLQGWKFWWWLLVWLHWLHIVSISFLLSVFDLEIVEVLLEFHEVVL